MGKSKDELPENWFKRISRTRHRGMEYFFNSITKERSWTHPLKKVARKGVAEWLNHQRKENSLILTERNFFRLLKFLSDVFE